MLRLSELQDENDPNDFNLPEDGIEKTPADGPRYGAATKGEQHLTWLRQITYTISVSDKILQFIVSKVISTVSTLPSKRYHLFWQKF